jgi:hypothetical protein
MEVYKYPKRKYLKQFFEKGIIRIGTLYGYRECETDRIRDSFEGKTKFSIFDKEENVLLSKEQADALTLEYHIGANICIERNILFSDFLNVPNTFVFCTSLIQSQKIAKEFETDVCYRIIDPQKFAIEMAKEIGKQHTLRLSVINKVTYVPSKELTITNKNKNSVIRATPYHESGVKTIFVEDYFTKPDSFKTQVEFRFIFMPKEFVKKDDFIFIKSKKLVSLCEMSEC